MEKWEIASVLDPVMEHYLAQHLSKEEREQVKKAYDTLIHGYHPPSEEK